MPGVSLSPNHLLFQFLHPILPFGTPHVLFMPSFFRMIPNLIAVSLLLPAAAAHKIKSRPRKGMLG